jgi:hypothetical protein
MKNVRWILVAVVVLVGLYFLFLTPGRENMKINRDNSKNWDVPELTSMPQPTPEGEDIDRMKARIKALESAVSDLKTKVR